METDNKEAHQPVHSGRWDSANEVKGTSADVRHSAEQLRQQVAKEIRVFSNAGGKSKKQ